MAAPRGMDRVYAVLRTMGRCAGAPERALSDGRATVVDWPLRDDRRRDGARDAPAAGLPI